MQASMRWGTGGGGGVLHASALSRTDHCTHAHKHDRRKALTHLGLLNGGGHCGSDYKEWGGGKRIKLEGPCVEALMRLRRSVAIRQE